GDPAPPPGADASRRPRGLRRRRETGRRGIGADGTRGRGDPPDPAGAPDNTGRRPRCRSAGSPLPPSPWEAPPTRAEPAFVHRLRAGRRRRPRAPEGIRRQVPPTSLVPARSYGGTLRRGSRA